MQMAMMLGRGGGGAVGVSSFPSPSQSSSSSSCSSSYFTQSTKPTSLSTLSLRVCKLVTNHRNMVAWSAVQESSTSTVAAETKEVKTAQEEAPAKAPAKPPAKAPAKPLPQLMEEDVIPLLKAILEAQPDLSEIELSFQDNRLEGSFLKKDNPYSFWAFFPDGVLTGARGFSLSSYGSGASTVEPFLIDEKKITGKHVVFWVEKRLAAQGIIPVWKN